MRTSVIVPAYQAWATLPAALEALRAQVDRPDRELVLVESSGDAPQQELAERWPWARVIASKERMLPDLAQNHAACRVAWRLRRVRACGMWAGRASATS